MSKNNDDQTRRRKWHSSDTTVPFASAATNTCVQISITLPSFSSSVCVCTHYHNSDICAFSLVLVSSHTDSSTPSCQRVASERRNFNECLFSSLCPAHTAYKFSFPVEQRERKARVVFSTLSSNTEIMKNYEQRAKTRGVINGNGDERRERHRLIERGK